MYCRFKTLLYLAATVCFVVLAPAAALAKDKTTWEKYNNAVPPDTSDTTNWGNGRIPLGTSGGDTNYVQDPRVIKDGSTYKMWYTGADGIPNYRIYYATSLDGLTWFKYDNNTPGTSDSICTNGTIALGTTGRGDDVHVGAPAVIKEGSTYKMWYGGHDGSNWRIYYATSTNGLTWTKFNNTIPGATNTTSSNGCVPLGTNGKGDDLLAHSPTVIKEGSTYKMWYTGHDGTYERIFHATSTNGLNWTKYDNSIPDASNTTGTNGRIPVGISGGDTQRAYKPTVIKDGSFYKMWYTGHDITNLRIYYATSSNGLTWTKYTNAVPADSDTTSTLGRIPLGTSGKGDATYAAWPCVIKDGYTYKMWYSGRDDANPVKLRIYLATCDQLPEGIIFYSH